jgi:hypothetical protein
MPKIDRVRRTSGLWQDGQATAVCPYTSFWNSWPHREQRYS